MLIPQTGGLTAFARDEVALFAPEMDAGVDRLSEMKLRSTLDADPNLKLISERSPYMRTERS